jgi:hypothetical protein
MIVRAALTGTVTLPSYLFAVEHWVVAQRQGQTVARMKKILSSLCYFLTAPEGACCG